LKEAYLAKTARRALRRLKDEDLVKERFYFKDLLFSLYGLGNKDWETMAE
jgi:hypothetical protein